MSCIPFLEKANDFSWGHASVSQRRKCLCKNAQRNGDFPISDLILGTRFLFVLSWWPEPFCFSFLCRPSFIVFSSSELSSVMLCCQNYSSNAREFQLGNFIHSSLSPSSLFLIQWPREHQLFFFHFFFFFFVNSLLSSFGHKSGTVVSVLEGMAILLLQRQRCFWVINFATGMGMWNNRQKCNFSVV